MQSKVEIPLHSFVDLITNSSSETYVTADRKSVDAFKKIVDAILKEGGSEKKCDDLFIISLEVREGGYGDYKVLVAHTKDGEENSATKLISQINEVFTADTLSSE